MPVAPNTRSVAPFPSLADRARMAHLRGAILVIARGCPDAAALAFVHAVTARGTRALRGRDARGCSGLCSTINSMLALCADSCCCATPNPTVRRRHRDMERPLNERGAAAARLMGGYLAAPWPRPRPRAVFSGAAHPRHPRRNDIAMAGRHCGRRSTSGSIWRRRRHCWRLIRVAAEDAAAVLVIGHNPGLHEAAEHTRSLRAT